MKMEPSKYYARHNVQSMPSAATSASRNMAQRQDSDTFLTNSLSGNHHCKDTHSKSVATKTSPRSTSTFFGSTSSNSSGYCSSSSSGTLNTNVLPGSGDQRKKPLPNESSHLNTNSMEYKCRDGHYSLTSNGRLSNMSPLPSLTHHNHLASREPNQLTNQNVHMPQEQPQSQYHANNSTQQHSHQIKTHHKQSNRIAETDYYEESPDCEELLSEMAQSNSKKKSDNECEHQLDMSSSISSGGPSMIYTVHRVVTTAQIQTALGNTYTSSSSVSSVVSAVRNDTDTGSSTQAPALTNSSTVACLTDDSIENDYAGANAMAIKNNNSGSLMLTSLRNSPGASISINCLQSQTKCNHNFEVTQNATNTTASNCYNSIIPSSNGCMNLTKAAPSIPNIPRPLQNVIPTCVYLMSRVAVHMEIEGTAQCPTQVMLAAALGCEELGIANKLLAQSIFGLWMASALLEIQLKSHHRPYAVRVAWPSLLDKFSTGNPIEKRFDEPVIILKRNVFFSKRDEEKIKDHRILELLYEEAKHNVLSGRYIMESVHSLMLGGIQARIELGPYNSHTHTIRFFRENQFRFLPQHVAKSSNLSWLPVSRKHSAEVKLLEQFKRVPQTATTRKLMRKYLEFCWALPFYGAAFFHGQVEQPVRGLLSLVHQKDKDVKVAINERGLYIIDPIECTLLLGLRYEDFSWDFAKPSIVDDPECQTCIFIQFDAVENGMQISKLMQVFSKQAAMMDALISHFSEQVRKRKMDCNGTDLIPDEPNPIQNNGNGVLCNKLSRLTLATFDEEGRCIGQMGSLSISY